MIMYTRALYRSFKVKWIGKVYFPTHVLFIINTVIRGAHDGTTSELPLIGITTHRNYQLLELPLINVGNNNVGNSEVFDRNFHFLIVSYRNYHCFLAAHRYLLVANFSCYGPSDDSRTILRHELYCNTHYIATSPKPHCNQYPNP